MIIECRGTNDSRGTLRGTQPFHPQGGPFSIRIMPLVLFFLVRRSTGNDEGLEFGYDDSLPEEGIMHNAQCLITV